MYDRIIDILHGILFAGFFVGGMYFSLARRRENSPKGVDKAVGAKLIFLSCLVALLVVSSFFNVMDAFAADIHTVVAYYLLTLPFCAFLLIQLTRDGKLSGKSISWHLSAPLAFVLLYSIQWFSQIPGKDITFWVYMIYLTIYSSYYIARFLIAYKRYEDVVQDIYADAEGRSINWLMAIIVLYAMLALSFFVLKALFRNDLATIVFSVFVIFFYLFFCHLVGRMRDASLIEISMNDESDDLDNKKIRTEEEKKEFLDNLRNTIISHKLYANIDLTRVDVAKAVGTNHRYLTENLKASTGLTFAKYIRDLRLSVAADMLNESSLPIEVVSETCGFGDRSTFYRAFSKKYGCSPVAFRTAKSSA